MKCSIQLDIYDLFKRFEITNLSRLVWVILGIGTEDWILESGNKFSCSFDTHLHEVENASWL